MEHPFYQLGKISGGSGIWKLLFAVVALLVFLFLLPSLTPIEIAGFVLLALVAVTVNSAIEIVGPYEKRAHVVFGSFRKLLGPGIHFIPPFVSRTYVFDMRTHMLDVPRQEAITQDNSPLMADAVIYVRVTDAKKAYLEVDDYRRAVSNLGQTTLRAVLGDMTLDETLSRRDQINARIRKEIDPPTDEWGVHVESVEVQEVMPSSTVVQAMEQQTSAERRRRAMILEAQGERHSAIERAEGEKSSNIIRAQGQKQSDIITAQGDAVATTLRAKSAESMGERAVVEKGMETLQAMGEGDSTTFVLPQELTSTLGRYGKHLTGSDVAEDGTMLESKEFDAETRTMLGLDDIDETLSELDSSELDSSEETERKTVEVVEPAE